MIATIDKLNAYATLNVGNRLVRAVVGASAILTVLSMQFSEVWAFVLSIAGFYASLTALIGTDLFKALFERDEHEIFAVPVTADVAPGDEQERVGYKKVA
jgi:hypothetical protein